MMMVVCLRRKSASSIVTVALFLLVILEAVVIGAEERTTVFVERAARRARADAEQHHSVLLRGGQHDERTPAASQEQRNLHHLGKSHNKQQTESRQYELWEPHEITETVTRWAEHYPNLIHVTTAQKAYGLPTAGGKDDCPFDKDVPGCLNQILLLQDFATHPEGSDSSNALPEVLWSGEVHGNEQVGPTAVLEATQLLLDAATCESLPRMELKSSKKKDVWDAELQKAQSCRQELYERGINDTNRQWLARLLTTRRIVVVPTANALGYYQRVREENRIDPNRDFPYDVKDPKDCMQTVAGRTLNEVFREHMFQLSLTFHGGMEIVSYEWGAPHWKGKTSPDDTAQSDISTAYSQFAGGWNTTKPYAHGPMNDMVYPVRGGMEDWAYAASWDPDRVIQCQPVTYNGYAAEKTVYDESTLRVFNMLVETSDHKIPPKSDLGSSLEIMTNSPVGNGHVARNIRLALLAAELVEPYVALRTVNELDLSDDVVPLTEERSCQEQRLVAVPHNSRKVVIQWTVGGALTVNKSQLYFAKWDDTFETTLNCREQPPLNIESKLTPATPVGSVTTGTTRFSKKGATPPFSASIDISNFKAGDKIVVLASARCDQDWGTKLENVKPDLPPQSHMANARTNPDWYHKKPDGKVIQGRLDWYSKPLTIVLTEYEKDKNGEAQVETEELSLRYSDELSTQTTKHQHASTPSSSAEGEGGGGSSWTAMMLMFTVAGVAVVGYVAGRTYLKHTMRQSHRERVREFIEDETAESPGLADASSNMGNGTSKKKGGYSDVSTGEVELGEYT